MTRLVLLLDVTRLRAVVLSRGTAVDARTILELPWTPAQPDGAVRALQDAFGSPHSIVLVVGLGWLEIARPELPPLSAPARLQLLMRDADRYFPLAERAAVAWSDGLAFAVSSARLAGWTRAFSALGTVDAVVTLPVVCARSGVRGTVRVDADVGEVGVIVTGDGAVQEARRVPTGEAAPLATGRAAASDASPLELATVLAAAGDAVDLPVHEQLLDAETATRIEGRRRTRLLRSVAMCAAALVALGWSADRWRARTYEALRVETTRLAAEAEPARVALRRAQMAAAESGEIARADSVARLGNAPATVLARLGVVLPRDAFVQRLDWDGVAWRLDGSALDAPRIVPLLDADPTFTDVRIVAASTRFLDGGRQRESFSVAFTVESPARVTAAAGAGGPRGER